VKKKAVDNEKVLVKSEERRGCCHRRRRKRGCRQRPRILERR